MKHIIKGNEPVEFANWKAAHPIVSFSDLRCEKIYPGAKIAKQALRASLKKEQGELCCYCECRLYNEDFHIEHFKPKGSQHFPALQLEYSNLFACCHAEAKGGEDEHCGHKKCDEFNSNLVSPLEPDCSDHFKYDMAGNIFGVDVKGKTTVAMLNLNSNLLKSSRKNLIEEFENMDAAEYSVSIAKHLDNNAYPLEEFFTTIQYLHNQRILHD